MNQADEFVIDGSEEPTQPRRGVQRLNYVPLALVTLAAVGVVTMAAVLGYRAGKKRGKGD